MTSGGPLDILGAVTKGRAYDDLLPATVEFEIEPGMRVRVLELSMLITLKEELGREKDRAVLSLLRQVLKEREKHQ